MFDTSTRPPLPDAELVIDGEPDGVYAIRSRRSPFGTKRWQVVVAQHGEVSRSERLRGADARWIVATARAEMAIGKAVDLVALVERMRDERKEWFAAL